eukprot:4327483-Karenia_brevis.AAC.1
MDKNNDESLRCNAKAWKLKANSMKPTDNANVVGVKNAGHVVFNGETQVLREMGWGPLDDLAEEEEE